jgi:hypothetical protein
MKNVVVICCIIVCSVFGTIACTKDTGNVQPVPPPSGSDSTPTDVDTSNPPKYAPGDSLIVRGDTSNNDETVLIHYGDGGIGIPDFPSFAAVGNGFEAISGKDRSIMKFILRHITDSSRDNPPPVKKALLYLYQYTDPSLRNPYSVHQSDSNSLELHRIVGDWKDSTVTWSTQPALAQGSANPLEDVVTIPAITTPLAAGTSDNVVIDITDMMQKIFESHSNKGFLLRLTYESVSAGRTFGSPACPNPNKRPKLAIYF